MMTNGDREIVRLAVPCDDPGGLEAARSGHFVKSPRFTVVDVVDDVMVNVFSVPNHSPHVKHHAHGKKQHGYLTPVLTLGENMVDVVIVAGIGRRPLLACLQAGMRVLAGEDRDTVRSVVEAFIDAELVPVGAHSTDLH